MVEKRGKRYYIFRKGRKMKKRGSRMMERRWGWRKRWERYKKREEERRCLRRGVRGI